MAEQKQEIKQIPAPGESLLRYRGDILSFKLRTPKSHSGRAWLRTNIGRGYIQHHEIIQFVDAGLSALTQDWHDLPMKRISDREFSIELPLLEVGRFEAKASYVPDGQTERIWQKGNNTVIKVDPAETISSNTMYSAFVRQFGATKELAFSADSHTKAVKDLDAAGYAVIPPSGKFRDVIRQLDFIVYSLRCRIIQLLPVFPTPTTYARMGQFGSPFAALDLFDVDPALAVFDKQTTPLQQFQELVDETHKRNARVFLDIPINHTGWASSLQIHHPEWFHRNDDDSFTSPGAWGTVWGDLSKLDYQHRDLWQHMAEVFEFWCSIGVDGFRLDAGYKIPFKVWRYIIARVRQQYPDTIFMLEGLGGDPQITEKLLIDSGVNWAYSELFQNYSRDQISHYLSSSIPLSTNKGTLIHFAETHDNSRLAAVSPIFAKLRVCLCALFSQSGAFGFSNGVEWLAKQQINVHSMHPLNWGDSTNLVATIARLHAILEIHPSFFAGATIKLIQTGVHNAVALLRQDSEKEHPLVILANLDHENPSFIEWQPTLGSTPVDLITGETVNVDCSPHCHSVSLTAGQVCCLSDNATWSPAIEQALSNPPAHARSETQVLQAKVLELLTHGGVRLDVNISANAIQEGIKALRIDPLHFCNENLGANDKMVVCWQWPNDCHRTVMIPPNRFLLISAPHRFRAIIRSNKIALRCETSIPRADGSHFALIRPLEPVSSHQRVNLELTVFEPNKIRHAKAPLLRLHEGKKIALPTTYNTGTHDNRDRYTIATNRHGAMAQVRMAWSDLQSKYDAMLAANFSDQHPIDRHVLLTRFRAWVICEGYSTELSRNCQKRFAIHEDGVIVWRFSVPAGQGLLVAIKLALRIDAETNKITLDIYRLPQDNRSYRRPDDVDIQLIVRPDIEDRKNHQETKAYAGPERHWPNAIAHNDTGFVFSPASTRHLNVWSSKGSYVGEPKWKYAIEHPIDKERGMDSLGDLFSPGYFKIPLQGGTSARITANATVEVPAVISPKYRKQTHAAPVPKKLTKAISIKEAARRSLDAFVVKRGTKKTVIAGYPWFLDWGRDTLIAVRGLISAGFTKDALEIIHTFASLEKNGTIPNMIRGNNDGNRSTSDAPLWLFVAVQDYIASQSDSKEFVLDTDCDGRSLRDVLLSIGEGYRTGTPTGIRMDPTSGLIFSPIHFTWMDTNHPPGTPRQGYPVEIQALWINALRLLRQINPEGDWLRLETLASKEFSRFTIQQNGQQYLCDLLRCESGTLAKDAVADDALRPNQLLAITLGAINDQSLARNILNACESLLVPGAIRSLADRPVNLELPILWNGRLLNDPKHPYWGVYSGDEDTKRKPAYHNGTAWTWLFPSYCEALAAVYGDTIKPTALTILSSAATVIDRGCMLHVPEILDGNTPHRQKGCGAQAWGASELYRVWQLLS